MEVPAYTPHPGRLVIEAALQKKPEQAVMLARFCKNQLKTFSDLTPVYNSGQARFISTTQNLKFDELFHSESPELFCGYKRRCLLQRISDFVEGLNLGDDSHAVNAYLFNKVARPDIPLRTVSLEDEEWKDYRDEGKLESGWEKLQHFFTKIENGKWKSAEKKALEKIEEEQRRSSPEFIVPQIEKEIEVFEGHCDSFNAGIEKDKEAFRAACNKIDKIATDMEVWWEKGSEKAQKAKKALWEHVKILKKADPSTMDGSIVDFFKDKYLINLIPEEACKEVKVIDQVFERVAKYKDVAARLMEEATSIRNQIDQDWEAADRLMANLKDLEGPLEKFNPREIEEKEKEKENVAIPREPSPPPAPTPPPQTKEKRAVSAPQHPKIPKETTKTPKDKATVLSNVLSTLSAVWHWLWSSIDSLWNRLWR